MILAFRNTSHIRLTVMLSRRFSDKIIKSKVSNIEIPQVTLNEYIWKDLDKWHNKTALVCAETGRNYLYSEVYAKCNKISGFLTNYKGLRKGDVVAVILPNIPEYPIVTLGAIKAGFKVTTVNVGFTKDEIKRQLEDVDAKIVFTLTEFAQIVDKARQNVPVVFINHSREQMPIPSGAIKFKEILEKEYNPLVEATNFDDVSYVPYSSGTTGFPKGVELTTVNLVAALKNAAVPEFVLYRPIHANYEQVILGVLPQFHIYGMLSVLINVSIGCKIATLAKFTIDKYVKLLDAYRPTHSYLVPTIIKLLSNNPLIKTEDILHMGNIVVGGELLGENDTRKFVEKTQNKLIVLQTYGATEVTGSTHIQSTQIQGGMKYGGVGLITPNHECKVISTTGESQMGLGPGQQGELLVRGPQIFRGYLNNAKATQSAMDSEGWYHTGDIGYYDNDEHFFITDRFKEIIKVQGFQVSPAELEEILRSHPDVEEAAVIGVPHSIFGEVPKAFIVTKKKTRLNSAHIQEYVASKVVKHKELLGGVVVIDSIPKNSVGKILRKCLKEL